MKTATILLNVGEKGSNVRKTGVTPAEAMFLSIEHSPLAGKQAVEVLEETEPVNREGFKEIARLRATYIRKRVDKLFQSNTKLPDTFEEALGMAMAFGGSLSEGHSVLVEHQLIG